MTEFGLNFFRMMAVSEPDSNILFSPTSVFAGLSMLSLAANCKTKSEIKAALGSNKYPFESFHTLIKELYKHFKRFSNRGSYFLNEINTWYTDKSISDAEAFFKKCSNYYNFDRSTLDPEKNTREGDFFTNENEVTKIESLYASDMLQNCYYDEYLMSQIMEIEYKDHALSLIVILPDHTKTSLDMVGIKLTNSIIDGIGHALKNNQHVSDIWLPKLTLDCGHDMIKNWNNLGIFNVFEKDDADLSKMTKMEEVFLVSFFHRMSFKLTEYGTCVYETAAEVKNKTVAMTYSETPYKFKADHPFIIYVLEKKSNIVLCLGKFVKP
ncbi:hypothetical protein HELRODRAFT_174051 [Helobdella robusta]|uniref:Serpin domain-containing protein n=1 Tax=Helobdella robusta TaxID=6412 RepID=T1F7J2_HELRO|nr:hypothetical protein HELRODRAFT_174051 [Helobdella robusta]ESO03156.1 hypothetical protein HELRODRAFT_174051 [Helobdella robusta]